jgi:hypothetical protein
MNLAALLLTFKKENGNYEELLHRDLLPIGVNYIKLLYLGHSLQVSTTF